MTLFFPDLNVWLALSVNRHSHNAVAWTWLNRLPDDTRLIFSRYTQLGLLRLLTNTAVMGDQTLTLARRGAYTTGGSRIHEWSSTLSRVTPIPCIAKLPNLSLPGRPPNGSETSGSWPLPRAAEPAR